MISKQKERDKWNKEDSTICCTISYQRYGKCQKKETEVLEIIRSLSQIKHTVENHSSRLEQVEDRISGLEEKVDTKIKTKESLDKRLKS
jgi:hypothetical protein